MKTIASIISFSLFSCATLCAAPTVLWVDVENPADVRVTGIPVVVPLAAYGEVTSANVFGSHDIPFQLDDLNGDGVADELAFVLNIDAGHKKHIKVTLNSESGPQEFEPKSRAYIKLRDERKKHPEALSITYPGNAENNVIYNTIYGHGACMESLHNAWRIYMDNRQSIDLYGKKKKQLELDTTGFYTTREQYLDKGLGRDILWAGKSVAAGSFRGVTAGQPQTIDSVSSRTQRVIASGPVRAIIEVEDKGWVINGKRVDMLQRYTQYGANPWFNVDVSLTGPGADQIYCTGVLKIGDTPGTNADAPNQQRNGYITEKGEAVSWGENIPEKNNKDLVEQLGIALRVNSANVASVTEDDINYLVYLKPDEKGHISYDVNFTSSMNPKSAQNYDTWRKQAETWFAIPVSLFPIRITPEK